MKASSYLENRVSIITGAGRGIGKAISCRLGELGSAVAMVDIAEELVQKAASDLRSAGAEVSVFLADVTNEQQISDMVTAVLDAYGRIDILVNNAGLVTNIPFSRLTLESWQRTINVNLTGSFICSRAVLPPMLEAGYGKIIFMSSGSGNTGSGGGAHYAASKTGLLGLVRGLTREYTPKGIIVNAIAPRGIGTKEFHSSLYTSPQRLAEMQSRIPLGRIGIPEEIANLVAFLASDACNYLCGQVILVDGGRTYFT